MVPNCQNWEQKLFKSVLKLDRGSSPRPIVDFMTDADDGVNWIKIGDTKKGELYINSTKEKITPEGAKKSRKVSKGEIIVSNSMSYGQPYILNIDGYIHDGWFVIRNYEKHFEKNYLLQFLGSELIQRQYKRLAAGGVVSNISSDLVYAVKATIPPLPEQRKIAQILSTWDRGIATTEKLIDASKQQKKALMQQLLTGKKRLVDPETGKAFEGDWEEVKLGDVCIVNPKKASEPENGLVSFIPMDAVSEDAKLLRKEVKQYSEVFKGFTAFIDGDVLVAKITPCFENGKGAQVFGLENGVGFGSTEFHVLRAKKNISSEFIYFLTNTSGFRIRGEMNMQGSAGQKRVTTDYLKLYKMTIPKELAEQQKIASVLTAADKDIELLEAKLNHLKQEKKALMQQLLTGKRRVKVAETEAA
ncbi:restriction endonuclease subunit S [Vibrio diabolicus]|uniref:restriction endonuclease subunit S n=1 Tax=Vibrio diabolicus TaxID=50719 RepID=UPI00215E4DA3|nr:restriction endonuclease subunit S [Vibrio diabolicus]MCS0320735.1 restriction endonuclease subunit S [Vibrio diabolicus]